MTERLKPCPFCGGQGRLFGPKPAFQATWVKCDRCTAAINAERGTEAAAEVWNRRAEDAEITRLREEVEAQKEIVAVVLLMHENGKARIKELEAAPMREAATKAEAAISEFYRYWTGGETRGSYDGRSERDGLWRAMYALRDALRSRTEGEG